MEKYYIYYAQYVGLSEASVLIQAHTHSPYSHTSIVLPDLQTVIEAWGHGVTRNEWPGHHSPGTEIEFYRIPCTLEQQQKFYDFAEAQVGKGYDHRGVINIWLPLELGHEEDDWFCSELLLGTCQHAGIDALDIEAFRCSPRDVGLIPWSVKELVGKRIVPGELSAPPELVSPLADT